MLKEFERVGMILDLTHLSEQSFYDALDRFSGPVIASHNNCRALVPGDRQFSDEQIQRLIERGAVIGAALDAWMLEPDWVHGESSTEHVKTDDGGRPYRSRLSTVRKYVARSDWHGHGCHIPHAI